MTTPTTSAPRRINADVFRRARREGATLNIAAYVARPPALDLDWTSHYQVDGKWADFEAGGRRFRVTADNPSRLEGQCVSCAELVDAYRRQDEGIAWMTPDEYDRTDHRVLDVVLLDDNDEPTDYMASLFGVCGRTDTYVDRLTDERYIAETVAELAAEALHVEGLAHKASEARRGELLAAARDVFDHKNDDGAKVLRDIWADNVPRTAKVAATYFALMGARGITPANFDHEALMADAEEQTPSK